MTPERAPLGRWWLAVGYAVALAALTFTPITHALNRLTVKLYVLWLYRLRLPGTPSPEDFGFALNVLLFIPVGFLLGWLTRWRWYAVALLAAGISIGIECVQLIPALDRVASASDVISNSLGGLIGALLGGWWLRRDQAGREG